MAGNVERFSGFAEVYDAARPGPPAALKPLLLRLAKTTRPRLVVDIGCGTGLSTRYWADAAERVVGVEPNEDMRTQALAATNEPDVEFLSGSSSATGLPPGEADIVTCSQALHWMEPEPTFAEIGRILRPDGVFAAYDYDWPPTTGVWEADEAYAECMEGLLEAEARASRKDGVHKWAKEGHLERMGTSGCFRFTKELVLHHTEWGDADRFIGVLLSQGGVQLLLRSGLSEQELGIERFKRRCREHLGTTRREWYWSSRVRIGIA